MDWIDVAKLIAPAAPALGGILGGFIPVPGASLAGQALGNVVARALGVAATPEVVAAAVGATANDVLVAKLKAASEDARAQWPAYAQAETAYYEAQAKLAESVNVTMRAEQANQHWFFTGWRAAAGWVFVLFATLFGCILMWATGRAVRLSADPLKAIADAWPIFAAFFGILAAMVGVYIIGRPAIEKPKPVEVVMPVPPPAKTAVVKR